MNKEKIKEAIYAMFASRPNEDQFSIDIIETLSATYECLYSNEPKSWNHADIEREEDAYFNQTWMSRFISYMAVTHKDKIKRMPDRSKATFWAILIRVIKDHDALVDWHKLIGEDVVRYVSVQNNKT